MESKFVLDELNKLFPSPKCELKFGNNYELIVAVILSAQCTDKRVNLVTPDFFKKFPTICDLASADVKEVESLIKTCGLYQNKARNLVGMAKKVVENYSGIIPENYDDLITLDGVGRKTANVVMSVGFGKNAIAVDTHVFRVSNRLGLVKTNNVLDCEKTLQKKFNPKDWTKLHYMLVLFGRYHCTAKKPNCDNCIFFEKCKYRRNNVS